MEAKANGSKTPYPIYWEMYRRTVGHDGKFLHFPRGTYQEQMDTSWGQVEMDLIETLQVTDQALRRRKNGWKSDFEKKCQKIDLDLFKSFGMTIGEIYSQ